MLERDAESEFLGLSFTRCSLDSRFQSDYVNVTGDLRKLMRKLIRIQNKASSSLTRVSKFSLRIEKTRKEPMITNAVLLPAGTEH